MNMTNVLKKLLTDRWALAILAGLTVFLSFEPFNFVWLILLFPYFFFLACLKARTVKESLLIGYLTSLIIMLGGFYWITYVIHEFGQLSWGLSLFLFFCFCGFGALNFPLFSFLLFSLKRRENFRKLFPLWSIIGIPALFTCVEWSVPKLFPWYVGHSLYRQLWFIQFTELTGSSILSFTIFSLGLTASLILIRPRDLPRFSKIFLLFPLTLVFVQIGFSLWTLHKRPFDFSRNLKIGLIQANIGNLEKVASKNGFLGKVDQTINTYQDLTDKALALKPDLILWPETAIPFQLDTPSPRQTNLVNYFKSTGTSFIVGAYAKGNRKRYSEYNSAFYIDPDNQSPHLDVYHKNILLAFGEYLPLGQFFPSLFAMFPQVSAFERGSKQNPFVLAGTNPIGVSICYEAIVSSFMRKVARNNVQAFINLTNDSWFGPTSEPYLHASLTVFRSIEHRIPLARVTNTGTSFVVDHLGRMSPMTSLFEPAATVHNIRLVSNPQASFYSRYGDWFIGILLVFVSLLFLGDLIVPFSRR